MHTPSRAHPNGRFGKLLEGLRLPLIQAPMAGGPGSVSLVRAVLRAGCLGSFGFAYASAERIAHDLQAVLTPSASEALGSQGEGRTVPGTDAAFDTGAVNANFFIFPPGSSPGKAQCEAALAALALAMSELPGKAGETGLTLPQPPYAPDLATQLEAVWMHRPRMMSFHFGLPPAPLIRKAQALGICVGISATRLEEAQAIEAHGADVVIAQGIEAGGHRGCFDPQVEDPEHPAEELVRILARHCSLPVIAAGGIMTGADVARMLAAGASAVQMGTAFLSCVESGASPEHKHFLLHEHHRPAVLTCAFSGRPARGLYNRFIARMDAAALLPFPLQNTLSAGLRAMALARGDGEYQSMWAGTGYRQCREETVAALIGRLEADLREVSGPLAKSPAQGAGPAQGDVPAPTIRAQEAGSQEDRTSARRDGQS